MTDCYNDDGMPLPSIGLTQRHGRPFYVVYVGSKKVAEFGTQNEAQEWIDAQTWEENSS